MCDPVESVHPVRDCMRLNEDQMYSASVHTGIMKGTRYTNVRRSQRRDAREHRVYAGVPSVRHDWRCPMCREWYSNYHGRNLIHYEHCKKKRAKQQVAREEARRAHAPLPSPDCFTPDSTPGPTSTLQLPTREHSAAGETPRDQQLEDGDDAPDFVPWQLESDDKAASDAVCAQGPEGSGKSGAVF